MTAIAGVAHKGKVWIGGDSAGVAGLKTTIRADEKVFRNGDFIFGFTSSFRMGQLLRYAFTPPKPSQGQDINEFMVTTFINTVRQCLKDGGWAAQIDDREEAGTFLVGYAGRLFFIDGDYQVGESATGYDAVGCGDELVLGALYATEGKRPLDRIRLALEAAARHSGGVLPPFHYVSL